MLPEVSYMCEGPMRVSSGPHGLRGTAVLARVIHIQAMAESFSYRSDDSDSDDSDGPILEPVFVLPNCSCPMQRLSAALWVPGEHYARCFECLNRLHAARLPVEDCLLYRVMLLLRREGGGR